MIFQIKELQRLFDTFVPSGILKLVCHLGLFSIVPIPNFFRRLLLNAF
jgi:hypothetical protein